MLQSFSLSPELINTDEKLKSGLSSALLMQRHSRLNVSEYSNELNVLENTELCCPTKY